MKLNQNVNPNSFSLIASIPNIHFLIKTEDYVSIPLIYRNGKFQDFVSEHDITWTDEIDQQSLLMNINNSRSLSLFDNLSFVLDNQSNQNAQLIFSINDITNKPDERIYLHSEIYYRTFRTELFSEKLKFIENVRTYNDFKEHYIDLPNNRLYLNFSNNKFEKFLILLVNKYNTPYSYLEFDDIYNEWIEVLDDYNLMMKLNKDIHLDDKFKIISISKRCRDEEIKYKILYS